MLEDPTRETLETLIRIERRLEGYNMAWQVFQGAFIYPVLFALMGWALVFVVGAVAEGL